MARDIKQPHSDELTDKYEEELVPREITKRGLARLIEVLLK